MPSLHSVENDAVLLAQILVIGDEMYLPRYSLAIPSDFLEASQDQCHGMSWQEGTVVKR
jgi:hypothetical protein